MSRLFSVRVFCLVFGLVYTVVVIFNWPLFRYYPLADLYSLTYLADRKLGPAMSWYGWIAYATLIGAAAAILVPKKWGDKIWLGVFWIMPAVMLAAAFYAERQWFFK